GAAAARRPTAALLEALAGRGPLGALSAHRVTEPVALFPRRAERTLRAAWPGAPLAFAALDVNQPWAAQDVGPASVQLVWGVNVFHLARDLEAVLAEARAALVPGGWLVIRSEERRVGKEWRSGGWAAQLYRCKETVIA